MGFPDWLTKWVLAYLINRSASVRLGTTLSLQLKSSKVMYADDLKIFRVINSPVDCCALQMDIDKILDWCSRNGMDVNIAKCNVITFTRKRSTMVFEYSMHEATIERVKLVIDLGISLNCKLRFVEQISSVIAKAYAVLGIIRRNTNDFKDVYCRKALCLSLVRSVLEYITPCLCLISLCAHQPTRTSSKKKKIIGYALQRLPWRNRMLPTYTTQQENSSKAAFHF